MRARRLYFDVQTGEVIKNTGETSNPLAVTPTVEHEVAVFQELSERNRETFGVIKLEYGQYTQDFKECNGYRVNIETLATLPEGEQHKALEFSYPDPNEPNVEQPYQPPLSGDVKTLKQENTLLKAQNQALVDRTDFHEEVLTEIILTISQ